MGSKLMYFIPHICFPIPKLIEIVKGAFDPTLRVVKDAKGKVVLSLDPPSITKAFIPPPPQSTPMLVIWDMRPSTNMKINLLAWLNRNVEGTMNFIEVP